MQEVIYNYKIDRWSYLMLHINNDVLKPLENMY